MKWILPLSLILLAGCHKKDLPTSVSELTPPTAIEKTKPEMYILAGQSNMWGMGTIQPAKDSVIMSNDVRYGPGWAFGLLRSHEKNVKVVLVQCSVGGSFISQWEEGGDLYNECVNNAIPQAMAAHGGSIKGMLYYQGEADAANPAPVAWKPKFEGLIDAFRQRLAKPVMPIVYAQIGTTTHMADHPNWVHIQTEQENVMLANSRMIRTADLTLRDHIHLSDAGYDEAGRRFYYAMAQLENSDDFAWHSVTKVVTGQTVKHALGPHHRETPFVIVSAIENNHLSTVDSLISDVFKWL